MNNFDKLEIKNTPLRNKTTMKQERATYKLFKQLVRGRDVPYDHILKILKLNAEEGVTVSLMMLANG